MIVVNKQICVCVCVCVCMLVIVMPLGKAWYEFKGRYGRASGPLARKPRGLLGLHERFAAASRGAASSGRGTAASSRTRSARAREGTACNGAEAKEGGASGAMSPFK